MLPFESVDTTSVSITDVIELHDLLGFGVVIDRHELSSTIVVNVVALVCVRPFESTTFVVDAITDGTVWHDFFGLGLGVGVVIGFERHELSSTIVVNVVALVCVLPSESTTFVVDAITDGTVWHDFLGLGFGVGDLGVVDLHDLFGMVINDKLVRVPVKLPFESVIMNF